MKTRIFNLAFALFLCLTAGAAHSAQGPNGGEVRALASREHHVLPGYSVELADRSPGDSKKKKFEVYVLRPDSSPVDLMHSGYWAVSWRAGSKEGRLRDNVAEEKKRT